ncbi:hypothetical protein V5421_003943, partial [Acinetobacter baumannii]
MISLSPPTICNSAGLIGLIYGPIIFALTMVLLRLYTIEFKDFLERQDNS